MLTRIFFSLNMALLALLLVGSAKTGTAQLYREKYRPQFHFSAAKGWVGDPDGLIHTDGKYHLFWWGHAVSDDLVYWKELPYPMKGDDGTFSYFSGSVVVDHQNTAGFGEKAMIAFYTQHQPGDSLPEKQSISISTDRINFNYYKDNPVLDVRKVFFRDPQVFWHESSKKWIMAVAVPDHHRVEFYASRDLKTWIYLSEFGGLGPATSFWECPDLFEMDIDGEPGKKKWVLLIGHGPNRVQYFLGDFDGKTFQADAETIRYLTDSNQVSNGPRKQGLQHALWLDYGTDFYATRSFRFPENPEHEPVFMGWMGNWDYARHAPSTWGKGFQSVPRSIRLKRFAEGIRLVQEPVPALQKLRKKPVQVGAKTINSTQRLAEFKPAQNTYELEAVFDATTTSAFGFNLLVGEGRELKLRYDPVTSTLEIDRTNCTDFTSNNTFTKAFASRMYAPVEKENGQIRLHVLVDESSIEVFTNQGKVVMSAVTYPSPAQTGIELFSENGSTRLLSLTAWELKSIWN